MSRVSVVIPSWNGRHLLAFCLAALARQDEPDLEIIVVDNGSSDDTAGWLARHHPSIRLLRLQRNTGFAAAANAGIAVSTRAFVLMLNNDAAPASDYVRRLVDLLESRPDAASCQGRILTHADPSVLDSLGIRFDTAGRAWQTGHGERDETPDHAEPRTVEGVGACAALYRRQALDAVGEPECGPFDETFFAYYEDVDLALRLSAAGWRAWLVPAATCEHVGSATGGDGSFRKAFLLGRNYVLYLARDRGLGGLMRLVPTLAAVRLRRAGTLLAHPRRDLALFAGELAALPRLPRALLRGRAARRRRAVVPRSPTASPGG